jgi:hypothetical protein
MLFDPKSERRAPSQRSEPSMLLLQEPVAKSGEIRIELQGTPPFCNTTDPVATLHQ